MNVGDVVAFDAEGGGGESDFVAELGDGLGGPFFFGFEFEGHCFQGELGIFGGHVDEAESFSALGDFDGDGGASFLAEPGLDDGPFFDFEGEENFAGDFGSGGVVLLNEFLDGFGGGGVFGAIHHVVCLSDEASAADVEHLDGGSAFIFDDGDDIAVLFFGAEDFLAFEDGFEGGDAVTDVGGFFKIEFFGSGLHLGGEVGEEVGIFAFKESGDLVQDFSIFGFFGEPCAGSETLVHVIVEAGALFFST